MKHYRIRVAWILICASSLGTAVAQSSRDKPESDDSAYTINVFAGFQPAGLGSPDEEWILHITDVPYFFGSSKAPTVYAGYDAYLYPDRTALLIEYRQSKGKIFERITEWRVSPEEFNQLQGLIGELTVLSSAKQAGPEHQQALAKQSLPSEWDIEHIISFSTLFKFKLDGSIVPVELFDINPKVNPLPAGLWESADILRPLPPLFLYGSAPQR